MEFLRDIVDSRLLDKIDLPLSLRNRKVEIIVLPVKDSKEKSGQNEAGKDAMGILSKYKNLDLIDEEKGAWSQAMVEKHANH